MNINGGSVSIFLAVKLCAALALVAFASFGASGRPREEQFRIPAGSSSLKLFLRHLAPADGNSAREGRVVLILHGGTLPSGASSAFKFDGHSWMDDLSEAGFDVWALDYLGYGGSDRYPEMSAPADANPPLGRAAQVSRQVASAVEFICERQKVTKLSIIAHSWGTLVAGIYATEEPARLDRLVLYGPVTLRHEAQLSGGKPPAYSYVTVEDQWKRFSGWTPPGESPVLERRYFDLLGAAYLASDPTSATRTPPSVQVPNGPDADAADAWSGKFPYDPAKIKSPTLIIRGEWETVTKDEDARWLYKALSGAPVKRDVVINRATHVMHLEKSRYQVYREVQVFLEGRDTAGM
ncbi:MAG TPA: alpha/beta fold hydrolase [Pyrinomonadaceae bacterium]